MVLSPFLDSPGDCQGTGILLFSWVCFVSLMSRATCKYSWKMVIKWTANSGLEKLLMKKNGFRRRILPYIMGLLCFTSRPEHFVKASSCLLSVPSAPQDIKITSSKPGVVCIEWSPPAVPNGKITSYDILYSDQPDVSDDSWMKVTKNGKF